MLPPTDLWSGRRGTFTTTNLTAATTPTITFGGDSTAEASVVRFYNSPVSEEQRRQEERRRELAAYLELLEARRERVRALARVLGLQRRPGRLELRTPSQEPKARSTSGAQRWRVRNPNA